MEVCCDGAYDRDGHRLVPSVLHRQEGNGEIRQAGARSSALLRWSDHYREKYEETVVAMDDQFFLMEEAYTEIQNLCIKNQELTNRLSVYNN